ncbi:MAG: copper resistance protein NlpE N-terminal domain-containing protein [Bacteroidota bacterium]|nr:copper resistance protein NlpE N-terminal domain-containing protein [Bacteroidota bacterium]
MMCLKKYLPLLFLSALAACNNETNTTATSKDSSIINRAKDTTTVTLDTLQKNTKLPLGFYQVMLPCADCKAIEHTIFFNPDLSYQIEEKRWDKQDAISRTTGIWRPNEGKIWAYKNDKVKARYVWRGDTLVYLEPSDNAIIMQKLSSVLQNDVWRNKKKEGIEFFGIGNEPFWNIEIDEQKSIQFKLADWDKPVSFKGAQQAKDAKSITYSIIKDTAVFQVTIFNQFCNDGMSDNIYTNKVRVIYKGQEYNGCGMTYK